MLLGVVAEARLREYVGRVAESGQGVLTIESRPHVDWMHAGWWRDVDIVLDECKKRGLKMMVFDDYWWPSQGMRGKYPIPTEFHCRDVKGKVYATKDAPSGKVANEIARVRVKEVRKGAFDVVPDGARLRAALAKTYPGSANPLAVRAFDFEGLSAQDGRMLAVNHYEKDGDDDVCVRQRGTRPRRIRHVRQVAVRPAAHRP